MFHFGEQTAPAHLSSAACSVSIFGPASPSSAAFDSLSDVECCRQRYCFSPVFTALWLPAATGDTAASAHTEDARVTQRDLNAPPPHMYGGQILTGQKGEMVETKTISLFEMQLYQYFELFCHIDEIKITSFWILHQEKHSEVWTFMSVCCFVG